MKRLPLAISFVLFILLCASAAYWGLQMFKPPLRPVAAPPRTAPPEVRPEAATALFGGRVAPVAAASNYQLRGVIFSGSSRDSVAIISADGKPPQAIRVNSEIVPGVTVKEVHPGYVILSDNGATQRVELPETGRGSGVTSSARPAATATPAAPPATPSGRGMFNRPQQIGNAPSATPPNLPPAVPSAQPGAQLPPQQPAFAAPQPSAVPPAPPVPSPPPVAQPAPGTATGAIPAPVTNAPPTVVVTPPAQAGTTGLAQPATPIPQPVVPGSIGSSGASTVPGSPPLQSR